MIDRAQTAGRPNATCQMRYPSQYIFISRTFTEHSKPNLPTKTKKRCDIACLPYIHGTADRISRPLKEKGVLTTQKPFNEMASPSGPPGRDNPRLKIPAFTRYSPHVARCTSAKRMATYPPGFRNTSGIPAWRASHHRQPKAQQRENTA